MAMLPVNRDSLTSARGRIATILAGFTPGQKAMTVIAAVAVVVGGFAFMGMESTPNYAPLFTNLQPTDAGSITQQLTAAKIPYQLTDNGTTVMVPEADVNQERIAMAQQGLPQSGNVGFSTLEKSGVTTSDFVQQVEYQQALESQLEQTIDSIQGVKSSQVSLVVPQQSAFAVGSSTPTTASILVNLDQGTTLSNDQVSAIVHLAASSTPGLSADNVTVADNMGDVLNAPGSGSGGSASSNGEQTSSYDNQLAASISALLGRVVGANNSAVQVHAVLNFDQTSTTTNGLQTNAQGQPIVAPTSTSTSNSTNSGTPTDASGVLGTGQATTSNTSTGASTTNSTQVTNAVGQVTQTVNQAPGQVVKTSVAVLLNSSAAKKVSVAQVTQLVTAAAGLNLSGGDSLVVSSMPFASQSSSATGAAAAAAGPTATLIPQAMKIGGLLLLLLGLLFFGMRTSKKRRPLYTEVPVTDMMPAAMMPGSPMGQMMPGQQPMGQMGQMGQMAPPGQMMPVPAGMMQPAVGYDTGAPTGQMPRVNRNPSLELGREAVLAQVNDFVDERPTEAARLLKMWADERDGADAQPKAMQP